MKEQLRLYNSETRQVEEVVPLDGKTIRMYTCGPTVYNFAHIGNFRTYVFEDVLRRTFKFFGFEVKQAMNLTDIDDKTINGALVNQCSLDEFTAPFKKAFFEDLETLGIERVEYYPQATDYLPEMIAMIEGLVNSGVAYRGQEGSIYFSIQKFPSYGRLAHLDLEGLKAGASNRVDLDEYEKENVSDFVLWKAYDPERDGSICWDSPFGKGRPGWHIECSAMAMKLLGQTIDIHVGGIDNLFPHHENEIAQSEAYSCCRFVKHWLHAEHLLVDHKKMSKRLGNFYTLRDLLDRGYTGKQVRFALLQAHYRTQLNFTFDGMDAAAASLRRLADFVLRLKKIRDEKIQVALELILNKALPDPFLQKQIPERLFVEMKQGFVCDIFDVDEMKPVVDRSLPKFFGKTEVVDQIVYGIANEKKKGILTPILQRALQGANLPVENVLKTLAQVKEEKDVDILDPRELQSILHRSLPQGTKSSEAICSILHSLKEKKSQGFVLPILVKSMQEFTKALADDLNIAVALSVLFDLVREVNQLCDEEKIGFSEAEDVLSFLKTMDQVLHCIPLDVKQEEVPKELGKALQEREKARLAKDWQAADRYRDQIIEAGYIIEDTPSGARLKKRSK